MEYVCRHEFVNDEVNDGDERKKLMILTDLMIMRKRDKRLINRANGDVKRDRLNPLKRNEHPQIANCCCV